MFTLNLLATILHALDLAEKSNKRAQNTSKSPEFAALYEKIGVDIANAVQVTKAEITKVKTAEENKARKNI